MTPRYCVAKRGLLLDLKSVALVWSLAYLVTIRLRGPQVGRMWIKSPGHNPGSRRLVAASGFTQHPPALPIRRVSLRQQSYAVSKSVEIGLGPGRAQSHCIVQSNRPKRKLTPATPTHPTPTHPSHLELDIWTWRCKHRKMGSSSHSDHPLMLPPMPRDNAENSAGRLGPGDPGVIVPGPKTR